MSYRLNRALFLDLDGTIIKPKDARTFPDSPDDFLFLEGILNKIIKYSDEGYYICIVSNQAGVAQGYITHEFVEKRIDLVSQEIEQYIGKGINYSYCPDYDSYYRKPNPGMAYLMASRLDLDLRECIMVGDRQEDHDFAQVACIGKFYWANDFMTL